MTQRELMPPRVLPWLYFGIANLSLVLAFGSIAWDARAAAGFFYHARLAAIIHLVTLGWITSSILGALYVVGPLALRTPMPSGWRDATAFAFVAIGLVGMVGHFWIQEFGGLAWSGIMVASGTLYVGSRILRGLRGAPIDGAVKLHIAFAFLNIAGASTMGVLLGFDKVYHFLPGYVLANVFAHAHFAAIGWASMMVVGVGYRLLPMVLPARMPRGAAMYASALLLEVGALGLFVALLRRSTWVPLFALVVAAGFLAFAAHVASMLKQRRRRPPDRARPDYAVRHAALAFISLVVALTIGMLLAARAPSELTMRVALAYGVAALVGFLGQMVAGMQIHLLPLLAWYSAAHRAVDVQAIPSPASVGSRQLEGAAWLLWLWGVPALATGFFLNAIPLLTAGAVALTGAALAGALNGARVARSAFRGARAQ
jgi:hypothetical protein